ncbi:PP2C family serine/threonine-protein phosphatase [Pseudomaricurvus sp. HS19]|uniref:PP2C family protein-serine/threonine phosphatase n=1 Tax=Pseudomaricurvus sp. HS19 TaxID=2692626 RepID=UPI00136FC4A8|nr:PP2C family serine/threonine-protein phosphatase [Pseudomaricurvus sp. HS19]MYM64770.1 hypothetical protein [Pseudomaricurvus sp. HS19]
MPSTPYSLTFELNDIGGRKSNQDRVAHFANAAGDQWLLVVADGVGGSDRGELAAQAIVDVAAEVWAEGAPTANTEAWLQAFAQRCNDRVGEVQSSSGHRSQSTLAALYLSDGQAWSVHAGDSRIYQLRSDTAEHSRDHSWVYAQFLLGALKQEELATHPARNQLLNCIDGRAESMFDVHHWDADSDAGYLVCSDGFWDIFTDAELPALVRERNCEAQILNRVDDYIAAHPGHDNTSALLLMPAVAEPVATEPVTTEPAAISATDTGTRNQVVVVRKTPPKHRALLAGVLIMTALLLGYSAWRSLSPDNSGNAATAPSTASTAAGEENGGDDNQGNSEQAGEGSPATQPGNDSNSEDSPATAPGFEGEEGLNQGLLYVEGIRIPVPAGEPDVVDAIKDYLVSHGYMRQQDKLWLGKGSPSELTGEWIATVKFLYKLAPVLGGELKVRLLVDGTTVTEVEVLSGQIPQLQQLPEAPAHSFADCLQQHNAVPAGQRQTPEPTLLVSAAHQDFLWVDELVINNEPARYYLLAADCSVELTEPLTISGGETP